MAKYSIIHSCGCKSVQNIVGKVSQRQAKADWFAEQPCFDCKGKVAIEETSEMVSLKGSEKQIAWASQIRSDIKKVIDAKADQLSEKEKAIVDVLFAQDNVKFWIDGRHGGIMGFLKAATEIYSK